MARFKGKGFAYSHPDYWGTHDGRPIQALITRGFIAYRAGPTCWGNTYDLTDKGREWLACQ